MLTNPNNNSYIGQSTNILKRISDYKTLSCKGQPAIYNSLLKYGFEAHKITILEYCNIEELNNKERHYINLYDTLDNGLNATTGGRDYFFHSIETRKIMSEKQKGNSKTLGRKQSKKEIEKRVRKLKGKKRSLEQRKRISDSLKGKVLSDETIRNITKGNKNKNSKKVINKSTGESYLSCTDAANKLKINKSTLTAMLNGQNKNKTNLEYV